ncbi:MAG: bifunctional 1-(5-phosphoribosyl)-5-((5-phosphoribosylamino)methylideneamino)imidazole-4-carboxamide isomerase/phosphoribosylanthranilate isomerase PriA [Actinobacteria bacterium]|uniref:1-(5-phosphoribosyl)-5-[(5-phosphoribosylamino)methylideneamino]imidazole-4-carboxamideisomerase n=1 Tax=freshwater metagenome TaxID=449393 RepID=A0A6J6M6R0_9ZZZZ|nr:bifunctional 1-(5-phosphoribosyl)-5-((5-phosphoribosylamino)methylideneamino)imidazole-4-carboxamide isomerase/phosphoribosylanthranilate isomerase PriA [Actinomycetota bacterium]MSZ17799.1 bifunctional 1-(5-phosphoribosyl)-5-((5-phosphoribosylamino)methylideneamino)imidazole-4-carboxamide isomerase/phosphoribosylanthranilate isomerase PriA [Actinomycetota bacterium]
MSKNLELLPAVDVSKGLAVRLTQGDTNTEESFGSALDAAQTWINAGAQWIHLVDLDAAFERGNNRSVIEEVVEGCSGVKIQLSGGIVDQQSLEAALATGATRVNLATPALLDLEWVKGVISEFGDRIAVGLDVRGSTLIGRGSSKEVGQLEQVLEKLEQAGCARYIVTDVAKDGMLQGPNLELLGQVLALTNRPVVASGGISSLDDISALVQLVSRGLEGAILGKALYAKRFTLEQALELVSR